MTTQIILPDNSVKEFDFEPTVLQVAQSISSRLAQATVGARLNGSLEIIDLRRNLSSGTRLEIVTEQSEIGRDVIRHSAAHIMAQAVQELWPQTKVTIGPVIENGFYYDFDSEHKFIPEDLEKIENRMLKIIKDNLEIQRVVLKRQEALDQFQALEELYKVELISKLPEDEEIGVYYQGNWFDLCRGPHVQRTGQIKAIKLLSLAGSYWRGDENKQKLQRIYATAFEDKKALRIHLELLEEAKKRDHRKIGRELGLFVFNPLAPGSPFFAPKGALIYRELQSYIREKYQKYGYHEVITPQIFDAELFHKSGHYENYKENMYFTEIDEKEFSIKPMNCPGHCLLYASDKKSYRDLPFRIADFGRLHRYERSGVMHGLTRVRTFCQDDAHIFCTLSQLQGEIESFMSFLKEVYEELGMPEYKVYFSTRPEKRMGSDEVWDESEEALKLALEHLQMDYILNEGDGAFYGPKLDIVFVDALKRSWQLGTLQCDFNLPQAFDLKFTSSENDEQRPVLLHRAILGSLERFIGVYLEHTAGRWPTWLSPVQVKILNLKEKHNIYCETVLKTIKSRGVRAELDLRSEKLGYKIRQSQLEKIPFMIIVGDKEVTEEKISVRTLDGTIVHGVSVSHFLDLVEEDIKKRHFKSFVMEGLKS